MNWRSKGLSDLLKRVLVALGVFLLGGCAGVGGPDRSADRGFQPYVGDARIWHEPGAEAEAGRVAAMLDRAIVRGESIHELPFAKPVRVHLCRDEACFDRLVRTPKLTAAVVPDNFLVLAPRLFDREPERLFPILIHELSHLHLGQRLGHYTPWIPTWFHEGLATLAADGGGAEYASDRQALGAWCAGRQIDFALAPVPDRRQGHRDFGLSIHEYYRQAWRAVGHLRATQPDRFRAFLRALQAGGDFHIAFADAYYSGPGVALAAYCAEAVNYTPDTGWSSRAARAD